MYKLVQFFNVQKILEIGTHQGASSIVFCQSIIDNGRIPDIYTVDNWSQAAYEELAKNNIEKSGFSEYIKMYNGDSLTKVPEVFRKIGNVDLVFIDGNHDPDYILKDFDNCKNNSKLILFHDTRKGDDQYLQYVTECGFDVYNFETRYLEGDGHLVGIALAINKYMK
jgi:predicted O-methyltransferase YrrM